jgi:hypothetical protein
MTKLKKVWTRNQRINGRLLTDVTPWEAKQLLIKQAMQNLKKLKDQPPKIGYDYGDEVKSIIK